ncbi:claudin-20-like [Corythoichthys intestinalis]|uniref:claudin-20-like n=1 Tax=Corythoichthys intestinalis TaxID=161448 RepID=UPI0025A66BBA|nr:claudin-20-like [Corythoichthys intestinalis]XP_061806354.1 claudin-20-like [Nerophis lumbriciformis]
MASGVAQISALALALLGTAGASLATLLPNWQVSMRVWSSMVAPVWHTRGLWMDCVWYGGGVFSCGADKSASTPPAYRQATRAAMVLSCAAGALGLCLTSLGLRCTRWGGDWRSKGRAAAAAGACFVSAGALSLGPAFQFAWEAPTVNEYRPGGALCVAFVSAGFLLAAGVIFCLSRSSVSPDLPTPTDPDRYAPPREDRRPPRAGGERRPAEPTENVKDSYVLQEYV